MGVAGLLLYVYQLEMLFNYHYGTSSNSMELLREPQKTTKFEKRHSPDVASTVFIP